MIDFLTGFASSIIATLVIYLVTQHGWPIFSDRALYQGIRIDGVWEIIEKRNGKQQRVGKVEFKQIGRHISGKSLRTKKRDGTQSNRQFFYSGSIYRDQVTLLFQDSKGVGFDTGSYIFIVQNDGNTMVGMATFHGKSENRIVSEGRILKKVLE